MDVTKINSVQQYISYIDNLMSIYIDHTKTDKGFLFRGESNCEFLLIPSLFRKDPSANNNYRYLAGQPNTKQILQNFIQQAAGFKPGLLSTDYSQWSEYAQHYGVPTRLLDWTSNPLVALFFSCRNNKDKDGSVSLLNNNGYYKFIFSQKNFSEEDECLSIHEIINKCMNGTKEYKYPITYIPNYIDARMSAQDSWFMAWGSDVSSLEDILKDVKIKCNMRSRLNASAVTVEYESDSEILFKVVISKTKKQSILRELDMLGVNEKTLFPGLDGLDRYIERRYRFDYDEAIENL